jgi:hypothetical protein
VSNPRPSDLLPARKADNLTAICEPIVYNNVRTSTSHSPIGPHGLLQGCSFLAFSFTTYDEVDSVNLR